MTHFAKAKCVTGTFFFVMQNVSQEPKMDKRGILTIEMDGDIR